MGTSVRPRVHGKFRSVGFPGLRGPVLLPSSSLLFQARSGSSSSVLVLLAPSAADGSRVRSSRSPSAGDRQG